MRLHVLVTLVMVLVVHGRANSGILSSDGAFDPDMREALSNAAQRYGLTVHLPNIATLQSNQIRIDNAAVIPGDRLLRVAQLSDSELSLVGDLRWSLYCSNSVRSCPLWVKSGHWTGAR